MTSSSQDSDASINFGSPAILNFSTPTVEDRELEMLIIASIQRIGNAERMKFVGYSKILLMTSLKKLLTSF